MSRVLFDGQGRYGHYQVVEQTYRGRPSRLLLSGRAATPQSGVALDTDPELLFEYNQRLFEVALSLQPKSVLVIGGGAFTLPVTLIERLAIPRVDAVEIDPLLPRLARKYFSLPRTRKLKVHTQDGRRYIDRSRASYDLIIVDAFSEYVTPHSLLTVEAAEQYARLLQPNGTVVFNIISRYTGDQPTLAHSMMASFGQAFETIELYPADPDDDDQEREQNLIFVASLDTSIRLDYLQSVRIYPLKLNAEAPTLRDDEDED